MASSGRELTPRAREVVAAARELLEQEGVEQLTMRRLAERLGFQAPSIYRHFADKRALEAAIISSAFEEQAEVFEQAVERDDAVGTLAKAYRRWATEHPHLYRLMTERPPPRERLVPGVEDRAAAPVVAAAGGDADTARALWAFAHGMVSLELGNRFRPGADVDAAWRAGIDAFRAAAGRPAA
jgi:AcrR family transcriptional regulator